MPSVYGQARLPGGDPRASEQPLATPQPDLSPTGKEPVSVGRARQAGANPGVDAGEQTAGRLIKRPKVRDQSPDRDRLERGQGDFVTPEKVEPTTNQHVRAYNAVI